MNMDQSISLTHFGLEEGGWVLFSLTSDLLHMRRAQFVSGNPVAKGRTALQPIGPTFPIIQVSICFAGFCLGCLVTVAFSFTFCGLSEPLHQVSVSTIFKSNGGEKAWH